MHSDILNSCVADFDRYEELSWPRGSKKTKKPVSTGSDGASTYLCDGCHRISSGWFTLLRVHALRPGSMDAGNGAQGLRKAERTHVIRVFTDLATGRRRKNATKRGKSFLQGLKPVGSMQFTSALKHRPPEEKDFFRSLLATNL